jgi:hypothetical protein
VARIRRLFLVLGGMARHRSRSFGAGEGREGQAYRAGRERQTHPACLGGTRDLQKRQSGSWRRRARSPSWPAPPRTRRADGEAIELIQSGSLLSPRSSFSTIAGCRPVTARARASCGGVTKRQRLHHRIWNQTAVAQPRRRAEPFQYQNPCSQALRGDDICWAISTGS